MTESHYPTGKVIRFWLKADVERSRQQVRF